MPQFRTLDYGAAIRGAEAIKFDRLRNQALGAELKEQENLVKRRQEYEKIRAAYESTPEEIAALEEAGLVQEADQLRESYAKQVAASVDMAKAMREAIGPDNYKQARSELIAAGVPPWVFPTEYSEKWMRDQEKEELDRLGKIQFTVGPDEEGRPLTEDWIVDQRGNVVKKGKPVARDAKAGRAPSRKIITRRDVIDGQKMSQDQEVVDGKVVWTGEWYPDTGGSGEGGFKAADSNAIKRAARALYATMWDPATDTFAGVSAEGERKALAVTALAEKIFQEESVTHSVAVAKAARQMGIPISQAFQDYTEGRPVKPFAGADDPLRLRD